MDLPKVTLKEAPIKFDDNCIDETAQRIIVEALDSAIDTSTSRLNSIDKIFPEVAASGAVSLSIIQGIRDAINKTPICKGGAPSLPKPPAKPKKEEPKTEKKEAVKEEKTTATTTFIPTEKPKTKTKPVTLPSKNVGWEAMAIPVRVEIAKAAGLAGGIGSKAWQDISQEDKEKLWDMLRKTQKLPEAK